MKIGVYEAGATALLAAALACGALAQAHELPNSIPERVRTVLDDRCIICHSEPWEDMGGLDLGHWTATPDGKFGFVHQDSFKKQRPSRETMGVLLDRITTSDKDEHMPLGGDLSPEELTPLVQWLSEQLKS
jgi:hypothetical protein